MSPPNADDAHAVLDDVQLRFGRNHLFRGLSCRFPRGAISILMGGSGSGKSTVLRVLGRLQRVDAGRVIVADEDVTSLPESKLRPMRRRIGMMFQGGALLDSLSVFDNVALPLREERLPRARIEAEVKRLLDAVELPEAGPLRPAQLSGGMVKRAALARALVGEPEILLCDEPFSGLDPVNVRRIEALLVDLTRRLGMTLVMTSHHVASSRRMAQQIVFLKDGGAVVGTAGEIEAHPDHRIADFFRADGAGPFALDAGATA